MKKAVLVFAFIIFICSLCSCSGTVTRVGINDKDPEKPSSPNVSHPPVSVASQAPIKYDIKSEFVVETGQSVTTKEVITENNVRKEMPDFTFIVHDSKYTKSMKNHKMQNYISSGKEKMSSDGTLTGNQSYLFLNLTVKNEKNQPVQFCAKNFRVISTDKTNIDTRAYSDVRYLENPEHPITSKSFYMYTLQAGQSKDITVGFLIDDTLLKADNIYYVVGNYGHEWPFDSMTRFIRLKPVAEE